ncbi:hypothetical protein P175DRAFT_0520977 [Aspergillus ochraceoroseus IBT 24754]|uniref:RNase H type-1 domain-containing protein n=1 Tax=Aspergillus ochraceoroseus IBT 24754 TaxID=1392256 RepID=A0A2T5M9F9_9EURO|nr:uncharacterized protein P175DRAFT_0520977 [Aspergillus ochraceoroseus IBT 24754]PTU25170.1 hypothetical protein P175DRAFT_0520977 [Aspergillus ochraceoroseus IBT 24754]
MAKGSNKSIRSRNKARLRRRQHSSGTTRTGEPTVQTQLLLYDGFPNIIVEPRSAALAFATIAPDLESLFLVWTDGSVLGKLSSPSSSPSSPCSSSPSSPSSLPSLPITVGAGASAVYEDSSEPAGWTCSAVHLPNIANIEQAELHGIEAGLNIALERVNTVPEFAKKKKKIVLFSDCQGALRRISEYLKSPADSLWEVIPAISEKLAALRLLGIELELRWVPAHQKIPGNMVADAIAKNAMAYTRAGSNMQTELVTGSVDPFRRSPVL